MNIATLHLLLGSLCLTAPLAATGAQALRINGSTTVNPPVAEAAELLRQERGMTIHVDTQGGSSGGIHTLGEGRVEIGMSSKHLDDAIRARYPNVRFHESPIGADAVALIVSRDVWDSGVRALSKAQTRDIYEGRMTNWNALGGPDRRIAFFNKEPGRGTWEVFAQWLYGDPRHAPQVNFLEVGCNEEARTKVATTRGAIAQLSASWADARTVFALGILMDDKTVAHPTAENIAAGTYPMSRPLLLLTRGEPAGDARVFVEFLLGPRGQELVRKHGYLSLDQLKP